MPIISPGDAFSSALSDYNLQLANQQRQAMLDALHAKQVESEIQQGREALALRRQEHQDTIDEKERQDTLKDVAGLVKGDVPDPDLLERARKHHVPVRIGTVEPTPIPQQFGQTATETTGQQEFKGTREDILNEQKKKAQQAFVDSLPDTDPRKRDLVEAYQAEAVGLKGLLPPRSAAQKGQHFVFDAGHGAYYLPEDTAHKHPLDQSQIPADATIDRMNSETAGAGSGGRGYQLQPELDEQGRPTGRFFGYNPKKNNFEIVQGTTPTATKAPPGAATIAVSKENKQEAVTVLGQLDRAIDDAAPFIGPGAGQVTSLEQLAGVADPKAQALATKMLLAKMKIDAGIGGMRAAASPQLLARWDNILANKITPEGLKAGVQAMKEILEATGGGPNKPKMSAADLIKKYGGQ